MEHFATKCILFGDHYQIFAFYMNSDAVNPTCFALRGSQKGPPNTNAWHRTADFGGSGSAPTWCGARKQAGRFVAADRIRDKSKPLHRWQAMKLLASS
jgi:hypothetical protein